MRNVLVYPITIVALALVAGPALAETIKLTGTYRNGQISLACLEAGGRETGGTGAGGFGCKTAKGEIKCTAAGQCTGTCNNCGKSAAKVDTVGILTNAPLVQAAPLTPQTQTRPPTQTRPLTQY
jgi:hypothetical protein